MRGSRSAASRSPMFRIFPRPIRRSREQSGLLAPTFIEGNHFGNGVGLPYFYNLAPNYDLTLTPTYFSAQGPFGEAEWRHRLDNGEYKIRVTGHRSAGPVAFRRRPLWRGRSALARLARKRGRVLYQRQVEIRLGRHRRFRSLLSRRLQDQERRPSRYYFQDIVSSVYLRGQADRGFFDLSGYHIEARSPPPISARSRRRFRCSITTGLSRSRPTAAAASAAR